MCINYIYPQTTHAYISGGALRHRILAPGVAAGQPRAAVGEALVLQPAGGWNNNSDDNNTTTHIQ